VDKWLSHPTVMKVMALALGILLWAIVHFNPDNPPSQVASLVEIDTVRSVPVTPVGLDEQRFVLVAMQPQSIDLTVRGTRAEMLAARPEDFRLSVDLSEVEAGTHTLPVKIDEMPRGLQLVQLNPGAVVVTVEMLQTREFEVELEIRGEPAEGYRIGTPILSPSNRAYVTLPAEELERVAKVGAVLEIDGESETIRGRGVQLAAYDAGGNVLERAIITPPELEVEIPITLPSKTVPLQFRYLGTPPDGLAIASLEPDIQQATIFGPQEELDRLSVLQVDVDLSAIRRTGPFEVPLEAGQRVASVSPDKVVFQAEVVPAETRWLEGVPIIWNGLGEGLRVVPKEPPSDRISIQVRGAPELISRLQPADVTVTADLGGRGPGVHTVTLSVSLPRFVTRAGGVTSVTVEIVPRETAAAAEPEDGAPAEEGQGEKNPSGDGRTGEEALSSSLAEHSDAAG